MVSVEAIKGYLNLAQDTLGNSGQPALGEIMLDLANFPDQTSDLIAESSPSNLAP